MAKDIGAAWSQVGTFFFAKALIDTEEGLYTMAEKREVGWLGAVSLRCRMILRVSSLCHWWIHRCTWKSFKFTPG